MWCVVGALLSPMGQPAAPSPADDGLASLLASLSLSHLHALFVDEELTMNTLRMMADDEADFRESMDELGVSLEDARRLCMELRYPSSAAPLLPPAASAAAAESVVAAAAKAAQPSASPQAAAEASPCANVPVAKPSAAGWPAAVSAPAAHAAADISDAPVSAHAAAAAAIAAAAKPPKLVTKWTPDGPRIVPEDPVTNVMAALAAAGVANRPTAGPPARVIGPGAPASSHVERPGPPAAARPSILESALASVAALDAGKLRVRSEEDTELEPNKPKVRSATQINHVVPEGGSHAASKSSVERSTNNKALEAYKRRQVHDPQKPVSGAYELDRGTMNRDPDEKRSAEAEYRDAHADVGGEHYDDI